MKTSCPALDSSPPSHFTGGLIKKLLTIVSHCRMSAISFTVQLLKDEGSTAFKAKTCASAWTIVM